MPSMFTVADVCKLALPLETSILAASAGLNRPVHWVVTASPTGALPYLEGDELLLLTPGDGDLTALIHACAKVGIAAICSPPPIQPVTLGLAEVTGIPVIQLPIQARLRDIERTVMSLLLDHQGHMEHLSAQLYDQLFQLASENIGLERIIDVLSQYTHKAIVVQDKNLRIKFHAVTPELSEGWEGISELLKDRNSLPDVLRDRHKLPRYASPGVRQTLRKENGKPGEGVIRLIAPIINQNVGRGYLSFIAAREDAFDDVDPLVIKHGATVCALEMARAKAISEAEKRLRGDFLTSLMAGTVSESEAQAEGDRLRHDMTVPHVPLVMAWYGDKLPSLRRLETLVNGLITGRGLNLLAQIRESEFRMFFATDAPDPILAARQLADEISKEARREYRDASIAIGIGPVARKIWEWRGAYREAANAADIARRLQSDTPLYAGDLGIYTILAREEFRDDLRALRDKMIGNLLRYEERQGADLLQTLEAFFQCHGNHTQTAELLSVHRNTLFYRMNRIAEITGLDLNQPDVRLAVHLSLKIHRLLGSEP